MSTIRVLSYNIHHGAGMDGRVDLERLAAVIASCAPDIVSLQEVDRRMARTNRVDQLGELARLTGMEGIFGCAIDGPDGQYGNAVLSRFPVKTLDNYPLPGEPRAALAVEAKLPSAQEVLFVATHLDTDSAPRLASVPLLAEALTHHPKDQPALLAGDFNARPDSPTLAALASHWTDPTASLDLATFSDRQIDYILFRPAERWRLVEARTLDEPVASDHLPLLAVLELSA